MKRTFTIAFYKQRCRSGSTILEVLFATMVLVIGLLGIASLIPFAARDAQNAMNQNRGVSLGLAWAEAFFTRGLHRPFINATEQGYSWRWRFDDTDNTNNNAAAWRPFTVGKSVSGSIYSSNKVPPVWGTVPICLDPYLMSSQAQEPNPLFNRSLSNLYRPAVFPYYDDGFDPTSYPFSSPSGTAYDQPRMMRATLAGPTGLASRRLIESIFGSIDDLSFDNYVDPTVSEADPKLLPSYRLYQSVGSASGMSLTGKGLTEGRFSWMATIVPGRSVATYAEPAIVSFVVLNRHAHTLDFSQTPSPLGERLVTVQPLSGPFINGNGGRVRLTCSADVDDKVDVGDWMMLSRFVPVDRLNLSSPVLPYFRWYRVIGADAEPTVAGTTWSRDVVLDGPDFEFESDLNWTVKCQTYGTLVGGVVTVVERQIDITQQ
jgi:hypothetical protein